MIPGKVFKTSSFVDMTPQYEKVYIPPVNRISAIEDIQLQMGYKELALQAKFQRKLKDALLSSDSPKKEDSSTGFFCISCEIILFKKRDVKHHTPPPLMVPDMMDSEAYD